MKLSRRQAQGMTEYIIIVGLIAILLVGAVVRYRLAIDATIQGTKGEVDGISDGIANGGPDAPDPGGTGMANSTRNGSFPPDHPSYPNAPRFTDGAGNQYVDSDGDGQPDRAVN